MVCRLRNGRFAHSKSTLKKVLKKHGLQPGTGNGIIYVFVPRTLVHFVNANGIQKKQFSSGIEHKKVVIVVVHFVDLAKCTWRTRHVNNVI
jgi:hypothetical protein